MDGSTRRIAASIFQTRVDARNGVTRIALCGELDMASAALLKETVADLNGQAHDVVLLDLRELNCIDSSGVRALAYAMSQLKSSNVRVDVVAATGPVKRVFELLGLEGILDGSTPVEQLHRFAEHS